MNQSEKETISNIDDASGDPQDQNETASDQADQNDAAQPGEDRELTIEEQLEQAKRKIDEVQENWNRERADFVNFRKRSQDEISRARVFGIAGFVKNLIPVIDNLDLVLKAPGESKEVKDFVTGVEMIRNEFLRVLETEKIRPAVQEGDKFDPHKMEAVEIEQRDDKEHDTVILVHKKAYVMETPSGDIQVLRNAVVTVARKNGANDSANESKNKEEG